MSRRFIAQACVAAALLTVSPAALAQNEAANSATDPTLEATTTDPLASDATDTTNATDPLATDPMATAATDPMMDDPMLNDPMMMNTVDEEDDDSDFPWGLLGLLGLAGLLGMKRRDDRDVHIDTNRDAR